MDKVERIKKAIANKPGIPDRQIARNLRVLVSEVRAVRNDFILPETDSQGIDLKKLKVLPRKPSESAAKFIRRLPLGRGFMVKTLSADWGMGEDSIRRHAKELGCLKYVEVEPDEWTPVVMNPETAKQYV